MFPVKKIHVWFIQSEFIPLNNIFITTNLVTLPTYLNLF
jgi:hypothetical protein